MKRVSGRSCPAWTGQLSTKLVDCPRYGMPTGLLRRRIMNVLYLDSFSG
jgi:hypothetical protein